jgi:hypothetical protein
MVEFLACQGTVVLEYAHILKTPITLQVLDAMSTQDEVLLDLGVCGIPQVAVVPWILNNYFMRADRAHAVVKSVATALRITFNPVERRRVYNGAR